MFLVISVLLLSSFQKPFNNSGKNAFINDVNYYKNYIENKTSKLESVDVLKDDLFLLNFYDSATRKGESIIISYKNSKKKVIAIFKTNINKNSIMGFIGNQATTISNAIGLTSEGFNTQEDRFTYFGVTYSNIVRNTSKYFNISNVSNHLYTYSSNYMSEIKILNVPNYKNTLYFGTGSSIPNGCTPTAAAMYCAYLEDNGYTNFTCGRNLPVDYYDNVQSINEFIEFLGNNYFFTSGGGTPWANIRPGYKNYVHGRGYIDFNVSIEKNYNEFYNSIVNCALPVPISISITQNDNNNHDILGIGIRNYTSSSGTERFIIANYGELSQTNEVAVTVDNIRQLYFITK